MCFNSGGKSSTQQQNQIPKELGPLTQQSATNVFGAMQDPNLALSNFTGAQPQQIASLTPEEQFLINGSISDIDNNYMQAATSGIQQLTNGPIGSSPATTAGMEAWKANVLPLIQQQQALQGTTYGGAADEAVANAGGQEASNLIGQEIQNRMGVLGPLLNLGQMRGQNIQNALQNAGLPRDVQNQKLQADYEDMLRRYQLSEQVQLGPAMDIAPNFGGVTSTTKTSGGSGFLGSVICTELHRQGYLSDRDYDIESHMGFELYSYRPAVIDGYHRFGIPIARWMRRSKLLTWAMIPVVKAWIKLSAHPRFLFWAFTLCEKLGSTKKLEFRRNVMWAQKALEKATDEGRLESILNRGEVSHHFAPFNKKFHCYTYAREFRLIKGAFYIGKIHRHAHLNFIMRGKVRVATETGMRIFRAPDIFINEVGAKRMVYAYEDSTWVTVHLTDKTDPDKIVEELTAENYLEFEMEKNVA